MARRGRGLLEFYVDDVLIAARSTLNEQDEAIAQSLSAQGARIKAIAAEDATGDLVVLLVAVIGKGTDGDRPFVDGPFSSFVTSDVYYPLGVLRRGWQDRLYLEDLQAEVIDMVSLLLDVPFRDPEADAVDAFLKTL